MKRWLLQTLYILFLCLNASYLTFCRIEKSFSQESFSPLSPLPIVRPPKFKAVPSQAFLGGPPPAVPVVREESKPQPAPFYGRDWASVYENLINTTLQIFCVTAEFNWLEPYRAPDQKSGVGSGFFIDDQGHFLTNYHVVKDAQLRKVNVRLPAGGKKLFEADVVGVCPYRDIALCKLDEKSLNALRKILGKAIPYIKLGNSDKLRRGESIMCLGYPLGQSFVKLTEGTISGSERPVRPLCLQISAPINPGSSGGPAINKDGKVIGINFSGVISAQNVGYVIPINDVKTVLDDLHTTPLVTKPIAGVRFRDCNSEDMAEYFGNPTDGGFYIGQVFKDSPSEKAGLKPGDVVYEINGHYLDRYGDTQANWCEDRVHMADILDRLKADDTAHLVAYRDGKRLDINFQTSRDFVLPIRIIYPEYEKEAIEYEIFGGYVFMELRLNHIQILLEQGQAHHLLPHTEVENQYTPRVIITHIFHNSPAFRASREVRAGAIVKEVNGMSVFTLEDLRKAALQPQKRPSGLYFSMETSQDQKIVLSVQSILEEEKKIAQLNYYNVSPLIKNLFTLYESEKATP